MPAPRILVIPGSIRSGSANARLAALAAKELTMADAEVTLISLADFPMPLYDGADATNGGPPNAGKLKHMMAAHQGVFIATPELNASVPPLLINAMAWFSRLRGHGEPPEAVFRGQVFALGAATRDSLGGVHALIALRQVLEVGCGALVLPEQICVPNAEEAFDDMDNLRDARAAERLRHLAQRLTEQAWERIGA